MGDTLKSICIMLGIYILVVAGLWAYLGPQAVIISCAALFLSKVSHDMGES